MNDSANHEPALPPVALTVAGSASGGGAGIQADLKPFTAMGVYGASALTAVTAQNTIGVRAAEMLPVDLIREQIHAVAEDLPVASVKTGMLGTSAVIEVVAEALARHGFEKIVVDPVMVAKSGDPLIDEPAVRTLAERLLPLASLVTPNRHEASRLLGLSLPVTASDDAADAAEAICRKFGPAACVVKTARRQGDAEAPAVVDVLFDGHEIHELPGPWHDTDRTHGSGCTFSAAACGALARGESLLEAAGTARAFIDRAIAAAPALGRGHPPVNHLLERHRS